VLETQPRADRRAARHEATKGEILEAAWVLARERGLAALSMRELAAAVGMRAPSLYQYFGSKHAIYDAMFGQGMRDALAVVTAEIDTRKGIDALRESGRRLLDFATSDPVRTQLLFQRTIPGFEPSPESCALSMEMSGRVRALIGELGITDPDAMDLWTALISGLTNQQLANDPEGTRWTRLLDRTVDMFLAAVASRRQPSKKKGS
jgi:AcrR family transcriptional regulator